MMDRKRRNPRRRGWLIVESIVGLTLMIVLIGVVVTGVRQYSYARDEVRWRQAALLAAEGQLERIRAGAPLDSSPPEDMVLPEITLSAESTPGRDAWEGFDLVVIRATADLSPRRQYQEVVKGYIPRDRKIEEAKP